MVNGWKYEPSANGVLRPAALNASAINAAALLMPSVFKPAAFAFLAGQKEVLLQPGVAHRRRGGMEKLQRWSAEIQNCVIAACCGQG